MQTDTNLDLTNDQWDTLRALRQSTSLSGKVNNYVLQHLCVLELVTLSETIPVLTPRGRSVLLRGSPRLWDLAA